jgi:hypothetical protein
MIIVSCNSPDERVLRIASVKWMPINAKGYHGSVMSSGDDDPDSWTMRCARAGYIVQNECS